MLVPPADLRVVVLRSLDQEARTAIITDGPIGELMEIPIEQLWPFQKLSGEPGDWFYRADHQVPVGGGFMDPRSACEYISYLAEADPEYTVWCAEGEKVFFVPHFEPLMPGHVYNQVSIKDHLQTGRCGYHVKADLDTH